MNPLVGVDRRRLRGLEHPVRDAHRQGRRRTSRPIPGLAESWKGSDGRQDLDLHAARGPEVVRRPAADRRGRRLHDQPRAATEEWLNYTSDGREPRPPRPPTTARSSSRSSVADPKLPDARTSTSCPSTSGSKLDAKAITKYQALDGVGSGPFTLERVREGPVRALQGQPELLGRQAGGRRGRPAQVQQPRRDGRRAQARRDRRRRGRPRHRVRPARRRTRASSPSQGHQGAIRRARDQRRRRPQEAAPGAARPAACARRSPTRSTRRRSSTACSPASGTPADTAQHLARPRRGRRRSRRTSSSTSTSTRPTQILDEAGYKDTDGDGVREMPGGGRPAEVPLHGALRGRDRPADRRAHHRLAEARSGSRPTQKVDDDSRADRGHRQGRLRHLRVGLDAVRRPRSDAVVLHVRPGRERPRGPDELLQRRELVRPASTTRSTSSRRSSSTRPSAIEIVHEMLTRFYESAVLRRALHVPRPAGVSQGPLHGLDPPAGEDRAGAVLEHVADVRAAEARGGRRRGRDGGGDDGGRQRRDHRDHRRSRCSCSAAGGLWAHAPAHRRRARVSARFVTAKVARLAGDARLRRRLQLLPVPRRRGRPGRQPLPRAQPEPEPARRADQAVRPRRLHRRAVRALRGADRAAQPRALVRRQPAGRVGDLAQGAGRRSRSSASRRCSRRCSACCSASPPAGEDGRRPTTR